jgi:hypothetical protein
MFIVSYVINYKATRCTSNVTHVSRLVFRCPLLCIKYKTVYTWQFKTYWLFYLCLQWTCCNTMKQLRHVRKQQTQYLLSTLKESLKFIMTYSAIRAERFYTCNWPWHSAPAVVNIALPRLNLTYYYSHRHYILCLWHRTSIFWVCKCDVGSSQIKAGSK